MSRFLLDSDSIIDLFNGMPGVERLVREFLDQSDEICCCDIVVAEVWSGLRPVAREKADIFFSSMSYLPTSMLVAQQAGLWRYDFVRQGIQLSMTDTLIAATAYLHDATLVTANLKDFPMDGLTILRLPR